MRKSSSILRVPSPLHCPVSLALVFEDDVLNLGFVFKYCLAIVLMNCPSYHLDKPAGACMNMLTLSLSTSKINFFISV